jgi:probable HAF family extracellular repeat protein
MTTCLVKNFSKGLVAALVVALGGSMYSSIAATSVSYSVTELGDFCDPFSYRLHINDAGQVIGSAKASQGNCQAVVWQNGKFTNVGSPSSVPTDINNKGQILGYAGDRVFLWQNGTTTDIASLAGSKPTSVNDTEQIVVKKDTSNGIRSFLWQNGQLTDLGTLGDNSKGFIEASDINEKGQVVGFWSAIGAFLWQDGKMTDLGTLKDGSVAVDINDTGQVVGNSKAETGTHAFLWQNGNITDLGALDNQDSYSIAYSINNGGTAVGSSSVSSGNRAVAWFNREITDLNNLLPPNSAWELVEAQDINNKGQIVGWGKYNGQTKAYLLTPTGVTQ